MEVHENFISWKFKATNKENFPTSISICASFLLILCALRKFAFAIAN
jgi:hypothetical protein